MNMMLEVDVLYIKQIEQSYLPKLRKLYLLATSAPCAKCVSQLSKEIETSRAAVELYQVFNRCLFDEHALSDRESFPKNRLGIYV